MMSKSLKILLASFVVVFFILLVLFILENKQVEPLVIENETIDKNTTIENNTTIAPKVVIVPKKVELKKQIIAPIQVDLTKNSPLFYNNMNTYNSDVFMYEKPKLEIEQIMQEYKNITIFEEEYFIQKKEDWEVDYEVGLEDTGIKKRKPTPSLTPEMLNVKIEFSKSF